MVDRRTGRRVYICSAGWAGRRLGYGGGFFCGAAGRHFNRWQPRVRGAARYSWGALMAQPYVNREEIAAFLASIKKLRDGLDDSNPKIPFGNPRKGQLKNSPRRKECPMFEM